MTTSIESFEAVHNNSSSKEALNLYAKVEHLLGVHEAAPKLYAHYISFLQTIEFDSLLDVGCGGGDFLLQMNQLFSLKSHLGVDLSSTMVLRAEHKGLNVQNIDVCRVVKTFDVVTAVYDMLNYLDRYELSKMLHCITKKINPKGYLIFDINTLYGFSEIAVGSLIIDDGEYFVTIDSDFDDGVYRSEITLFEQSKDKTYKKTQEQIDQYYHTVPEIESLLVDMKLIIDDGIMLYNEGIDKKFVVFQKVE